MAEFRCAIRGEIDSVSSPQLYSDLDLAIVTSHGSLVIDCSELTFMDASGISVLIDVHRRLERLGRGLRIENLSPQYRRIFEKLELVDVSSAEALQDAASSMR